MTPADIKVVWPTPEQIARAVFAASGMEGDDPEDVLQGVSGARSRAYAFLALAWEYPTVPRATLGRKVGKSECAKGARQALIAGAWSWFDLGCLNAIRAALGWPDMTLEDAKAAPLIYCGRSWEEFVDRAPVEEAAPLASPDVQQPEAGGGSDEPPAPTANAITKATNGKTQAEGRTEDGTELRVGEAGVAHPLPGAGDVQSVSRADGESERLAAVERMKAWGRNEPIPEPVPAPVADVETPPIVAPAPLASSPPSSRAAALADAARAMHAAKSKSQRVTPPALVKVPTRRAIDAKQTKAANAPMFAPAFKNTRNKIADTRRPQNELQGRLVAEAHRGVTSFRPDPPAEKRGAVNVTSDLMGDPKPERSALAKREAGR